MHTSYLNRDMYSTSVGLLHQPLKLHAVTALKTQNNPTSTSGRLQAHLLLLLLNQFNRRNIQSQTLASSGKVLFITLETK